MGTSVVIDPVGIATVRTSIERVLAPRGLVVDAPFRTANDFPAYWRRAVALHGGDDLTMCVASEPPVGAFGRTSYAIASASTIGEALNVFRRDSQRAIAGITTELEVTAARATLRLRGPELVWPLFEILLGIVALRCRQLAQPPAQILAATLPTARPSDPAPWHRVFTVAPRFGADHASIAIPAAHVALPLRTADVAIREALGGGPIESTADEVRGHVRAWIREAPEIGEVARALGMSLRTLQRRLRDEQVSFRQLVIEVKIDVAKRLLEHEHMSVSEVATAVGFSRIPAFTRAFSQQVGVSPSTFRALLPK